MADPLGRHCRAKRGIAEHLYSRLRPTSRRTSRRTPLGRAVFAIVDVPPLSYLMIDGHGDPDDQEYGDAITTIFSVPYKLKFMSKREQDRDYVVMPLEALWWSDDMAAFTSDRDKSRWDWTAMNLVPDWITDDQFEPSARAAARTRRRSTAAARDATPRAVASNAPRRLVRRRGTRARGDARRVHSGAGAAA